MTNCLYLLFSVHHHLLLKCLTLAPTTYMYYMHVLVYSLLHICDSMAGHWTTSPPCLQVDAPGHKEHEEPLAISIPSHYWMENYSSLGSKFRSRLPVARMQHEVLTQRAAKPCQQVMMLSTIMRTGGPLVSLTVPFGGRVRL